MQIDKTLEHKIKQIIKAKRLILTASSELFFLKNNKLLFFKKSSRNKAFIAKFLVSDNYIIERIHF